MRPIWLVMDQEKSILAMQKSAYIMEVKNRQANLLQVN